MKLFNHENWKFKSHEEASTAFHNDQSITISDPLHSESDDRFILLGYSKRNRLIVVVHLNGNALLFENKNIN
ncbi:MAG: BrnT family toxin [Calditrichaeota bacterium]|nr:MAG: BrnT family toxin [Calditrichota bacterium]